MLIHDTKLKTAAAKHDMRTQSRIRKTCSKNSMHTATTKRVNAFGNALGGAFVESLVTSWSSQQDVSQASRARDWATGKSDEEIDDITNRIGDEYGKHVPSKIIVASNGAMSGMGSPRNVDGERYAGDLNGYLKVIRNGVEETTNSFKQSLEERMPGLSKTIQVVAESLPDLIAGAKQELKDAASGIATDMAIAAAGVLLAKFTGGTSLALSLGATIHRVDKAVTLTENVASVVDQASAYFGKIDQQLQTDGSLVSGLKSGVVGMLGAESGSKAKSIADMIAEKGGKALPGLENEKIRNVLGGFMAKADDIVNLATLGFTKNNAFLNAVVGAAYRHYDVAEKITGFVLQHSGLFKNEIVPATGLPAMGPIQNKSGHGIDWIGRALTGRSADEFLAVEVKGGLNRSAGGLSSGQLGVNNFADTRIGLAAGGKGVWAPRNTAYGTQDFAAYIQNEMKFKSYEGILFQHDFMRSGHTKVRTSIWN